MITTWSPRRRAAFTALGLALLLSGALAACSSGSGKSTTAAATPTVSASPSASSSGARGARAGLFSDPKVEQCLSAAGIAVPSRAAGARPSFTGPRPSGSARPSFSGSRAPGGFFGGANGTKIEAALKACGITLPTGGFRDAAPSATPSSPAA